MSLETTIYPRILAVETIAGDLQTTVSQFAALDPITMSSGTSSGKADLKYSDTLTVGTGGTTLDLNALTDADGRTINFVKVKALLIKASTANTNTVVVGNGATSPFQGPFDTTTWTATLPAGAGMMLWYTTTGWVSTGAAFDKLKLTGGAASQDVSIYIVGTSA